VVQSRRRGCWALRASERSSNPRRDGDDDGDEESRQRDESDPEDEVAGDNRLECRATPQPGEACDSCGANNLPRRSEQSRLAVPPSTPESEMEAATWPRYLPYYTGHPLESPIR
jgi:hypothetical protein